MPPQRFTHSRRLMSSLTLSLKCETWGGKKETNFLPILQTSQLLNTFRPLQIRTSSTKFPQVPGTLISFLSLEFSLGNPLFFMDKCETSHTSLFTPFQIQLGQYRSDSPDLFWRVFRK